MAPCQKPSTHHVFSCNCGPLAIVAPPPGLCCLEVLFFMMQYVAREPVTTHTIIVITAMTINVMATVLIVEPVSVSKTNMLVKNWPVYKSQRHNNNNMSCPKGSFGQLIYYALEKLTSFHYNTGTIIIGGWYTCDWGRLCPHCCYHSQ